MRTNVPFDGGRPSGRRIDAEVSVDRLRTFLEPDETRSLRRVGATATVVDDRDDGRVADHVARDPDARGLGVLDDVRHRLGDDVVQSRLDGGRDTRHVDVDPHRKRAAAGDLVARGGEAVLGEDLRGDVTCGLTKLVQRLRSLGPNLAEQRPYLLGVVGSFGAGEVELQAHEALLGPVVDVSLEAAHGVGFGRLRRLETRRVLAFGHHRAKRANGGVDEKCRDARLNHREAPHHPGQNAEDERNADEHGQHAQPAGHEDGERDEAQQVDPPACEQVGAVAQCLAWGPAELAVRRRAGGVRGDRGCDVWSAHLFDAMERHGGTIILPAGFLTVGKTRHAGPPRTRRPERTRPGRFGTRYP